ncbi:MAG: type II secretion system secretin GspD, partial [Burkholderiales bacterium]|nr:type II secretion system secretin GspD [Burkholderiales bacterium]
MSSGFRLWLVIFCIFVNFSAAIAAPLNEEKVTLNFVNADIATVIKAVGEITGKNFILDPRVNGTVNIISSRPVPRDMVYQILLSALRLQGFTAIEGPGVTKILPEADAKQNASATVDKDSKVSGDRIITQVYPLEFESAAPLVPILRPLITPNNTISVYPNTNTLVITDYADNIKRISKIIESIDRQSSGETVVINLQYASAVDLAQLLTKLAVDGAGAQAAAGAGGARLSIVADPRSNSLLVRADHPSYIERVRKLVQQLDIAVTAGGSIHVVHLRNADAEKIAETLRAILTGDSKGAQSSTSTDSFAPGTALPGTPSLGTPLAPAQSANPPSAPLGQSLVTPPGALGTGGAGGAAGSGIASVTGQGGFIQADIATNSLIIAAPDNVYNSLRAVIDQLDSRRAQVYLEALIAEVSTDKAAEFGIQFQDFSGLGETGTQVVGGTNFSTTPGSSIVGAAITPLAIGRGLNIGVVRGTITVGGVEIINLGVLVRALEGDANSNVLSTPNLLTLDNEEAKIVVGQNVPFVTGSFAQATSTGTAGAAVNPFQTIDRRDVGLTLKIKPQIAEGGTVKMLIFQEVSSIQPPQPGSLASDIITNKRSIESTVLVDDGNIIVLGGLIQDDVRNSIDKVPLLGDIPGIGYFFRYESRRRVKTNLMVFLRPVVLQESISGSSLTTDR